MIVGGEQGLGPQLFRVGAVFQHGPGNGHAVEGRGAPADLVQNQQAVRRGGLENVADLRHLHHEGGLSGGQIVAGADAGENAIHHADAGGPGRHEGADLGHQHNQRHLTHVGGFTGHVGAGDDGHPVISGAHVGVVGDEHAVPPHLLHHRMAAVVDLNDAGLVHHGAAVVVLHRHGGQRAQGVQLRHQRGGLLHPGGLGGDMQPQIGEQLVFQRRDAVVGGENVVLQILQFLGDVPLAADQRLLADIALRHLILKGVGHLDIVAEHLVVADLQGADAGPFLFGGLHADDHVLAAVEDAPQTIHLRVEALTDHLALADGKGRLIHQRLADEGGQIVQVVQLPVQLEQAALVKAGQLGLHLGQALHGGAEGDQIPASCRAVHDAAHQTLHVGDALQGQYQLLTGHSVLGQRRHGGIAPVDLRDGQQGTLQPRADHAAAHGGFRLVQHPQETALLLLAAESLGQLQIAPGRQVQLHELAPAVVFQIVHMGQVGLLCLVQVAQQCAQRQEYRRVIPRQAVQRVITELAADQPFGGLHLEAAGRQLLQMAVQLVLQEAVKRFVEKSGLVDHRLGRGEAAQLVDELLHPLAAGKGGGVGLAGGDVADAHSGVIVVQIDTGAEVGAALVQTGAVDDRAGGHHADDVPLHQTLGLGGILRLLADGHLIALGDEPGDIGIRRVVGHAAHGHPLLDGLVLALVPAGQRQIQLAGRRFGVGAEHLIEVTQTEEQDGVLVLFLYLQVLLHHGGQFCHRGLLSNLYHLAEQRPGVAVGDLYVVISADGGLVAHQMHQPSSGGAGRQGPAAVVTLAVDQAAEGAAHILGMDLLGDLVLGIAQPVKPHLLFRTGDGILHFGGGRAGPGREDEGEQGVEPHLLHQRHRLHGFGLRLAGEADDHVAGQHQLRHDLPGVGDEL